MVQLPVLVASALPHSSIRPPALALTVAISPTGVDLWLKLEIH